MNIYDISEKAGVSIATVSRVINNNAKVSAKTREKVMAVIEENGYTPNVFARGLGLNTMHTIGILCANSSDPYLANAIYYLEQMLRENGYDSLLCCTGYKLENKKKYLNLLVSKRVDGIILAGSNYVEVKSANNQYIEEVAKNVPIMLLNGAMDGENIYCSLCDDFHAVYEVTKELLSHNRKKILYLYNANSYSGKKKLQGFHEAHKDMGTPASKDYVQYVQGNLYEVKDHLLSLHRKGINFDAVIASDDSLAVSVLKYAKESNISIPKELSVIGYNNSFISQCSNPEITSIDNKLETICQNCVSNLMSLFSQKPVPFKSVFSAEMIKRETTDF